jgi:hypothetical protein
MSKCPFHGLFSGIFLRILSPLLLILLFKRALKHSAEVLSTIPEHKNPVMCLMVQSNKMVHFVQEWITVLVTGSSVLMKHVSLNSHVQKTRLYINLLRKNLTRYSQDSAL